MNNYYSEKKVLVTGAAGFIGSYICEALITRGAKVTAVVRKKSKIKNLSHINKKLTIKEVNLTNKKQLQSLVKSHTLIIHAAAVDGGTQFKKIHADKIFHDNVHMTMNLFESLKKSSVEKLIFISTAEVYTNLKNKKNISEEQFSLFSPTQPEQWYAFSKIIGELTAQLIGNALGIQVIIVRPANIYGLKDHVNKKRLVPIILDAIKKKKKKVILGGTGKDIRSFLHIEDYVENLLQLVEKSSGGTYNVAGDTAVKIKDFVSHFTKESGMSITFKDKSKKLVKPSKPFYLDISKIKKTVTIWHDSPYQNRIKEMLKDL